MDNEPEGLREALADALDLALFPPGEWHPIDTAPKDGRTILIWSASEQVMEIVYWDEFDEAEDQFTHWMEIPEPPDWKPNPTLE